jgi:transposase
MEGKFYLGDEDRGTLEEFHRACLDKKTADKIKVYRNEGIDGLVRNNYQGSSYKLTDEQIKELKQELDVKTYRIAEEVCEYVWKRFKASYTVKGMVHWSRDGRPWSLR